MQTSSLAHFRTLPPTKKNPSLLISSHSSLFPPLRLPLWTPNLLSVFMNLSILELSYNWKYEKCDLLGQNCFKYFKCFSCLIFPAIYEAGIIII